MESRASYVGRVGDNLKSFDKATTALFLVLYAVLIILVTLGVAAETYSTQGFQAVLK